MKMVKKFSRIWEGYNIFERIFWAVILTMSFYGMGIFSYYTFKRYDSDPVSMTVETEYIHWNSSFPAISICLVKGKGTQPLQPIIRKLNISYRGSETNFLRNVHTCMFANANHLDKTLVKCDELRSMYGINIEDLKEMLLPKSCNQFLDFVCYGQKIYDCTDVFKFHKTELGHCFIGNSIIDYGYSFDNLKLKYDLASESKRLSMRLKVFKLWQYALHVHSPEDLPFYNSISKEIFSTEILYSYNIDKIITDADATEKSIRQRGCRFPDEILYGSPFHYSFSTCMSFLRMQVELQECNCTHLTFPKIFRSHYCNFSGLECLSNGNINSKARRLAMERTVCVPSCTEQILKYIGQSEMRLETNATYTNISIEVLNLPSARYKRAVIRTKLDLAVSIAGLAGLFFGASVLNFVEVFYYLLTVKYEETMIVFVYDTEYCKDETHDPINAVLYFHPSWVSDIQKVALCGQLMGTSHFLKYCFFRPKIIALQNGKFVFKEFGRFLVAIGTDRNISDYLLEHRANLLASLIEFFHRDLQTIYDQFPVNKYHGNVSEKLYHIFGTYLPILQYNGNIFQNVPKLRIPKIAGNIFLDAMQTLQSCQQTKGVLGGAILYHNKIVASQLSDVVTKNIVFTDPHRIKSTAEIITVNFHVPVGVQMIVVYIPFDQYRMLSSDAYRSQNLQTQNLSNNALPTHFQKRKMKRDRSIIFTNIPEEINCDQVESNDEIVKTKRTISRPTHLHLKDVIPKDLPESGFASTTLEESGSYPEFIGRTSVCSTPMTENKIVHGSGIMSICANPNEDLAASKIPVKLRNSLKVEIDRMFSSFLSNPKKMERRNSFTDLQDSVKKISKKFALKKKFGPYKADIIDNDDVVIAETAHHSPDDESPGHTRILRAISDPIYPVSSLADEAISCTQFVDEYNRQSNETKQNKSRVVEDAIELSKKMTINIDANVGVIENASVVNTQQIPKRHEAKTPLDKKSLSLPLKAHSEIQNENTIASGLPFERKRVSGIQLTPLMAKLSILALNEERVGGFSSRDNTQFVDIATPTDGKKKSSRNSHAQMDGSVDGTSQYSDGFQKVELYVCGQQNMTMFLLLEQGSGNKQEIVQAMFDKCVAKLAKMESHLYQTLNVNMMEGVSEGIYSLICVDSKWDTLLNNGPWTPLDQSFLEHVHTDLSKGQLITDIFLRTNDCTLYGYKSGRIEFYFKESAHYFTGIPPPSDPLGTIATRAKSRLEEDFSIVLF